MALISGGHLVGRALKNEGVKYFFTLAGSQIGPIYTGCHEEGIQIIDVRHEQAAAHAAEGWARVTGEPGSCGGTAGPGVTNMTTGVACAYFSSAPVIVFGGRTSIVEAEKGPCQEMDHTELMRPITKWARTVLETHRIPEYISLAFKNALAGRPGPVFLDIPEDLAKREVDEEDVFFPEPARSRATSQVQGNPDLIKQAAKLLASARQPAIVGGNTLFWSKAHEELKESAELIKAPTFLNAMGRGCLPADHPLFCSYSRRYAVGNSDVALIIGAPIDFRLNFGQAPLFNPETKIIQIDIDQAEFGHNLEIDLGIMGDTKQVLRQLVEELERLGVKKSTDWAEKIREKEMERVQAMEAYLNSDATPIHPLRVFKEIRDYLDRDATIVGDGGSFVTNSAQVLRTYEPGHWLDPGKFGCLGVGTGYAMAAKLARPDKQVLLVYGDGSFGLNGMEFDTAVRHNLPFVSVVGNNAGWSPTRPGSPPQVAHGLRVSRYDKMVEALGGHGEFVERPEQIRPALERAFNSGLPAALNVVIDPAAGYEGQTPIFGLSTRRQGRALSQVD